MYKQYVIWGRQFDIEVVYDLFPDEALTETMKSAEKLFDEKCEDLLADSTPVVEYCLNDKPESFDGSMDNIFKYVIPEQLYIANSDGERIMALLCAYRFDEEHGIAIVFKNEELSEIGSQDIIL